MEYAASLTGPDHIGQPRYRILVIPFTTATPIWGTNYMELDLECYYGGNRIAPLSLRSRDSLPNLFTIARSQQVRSTLPSWRAAVQTAAGVEASFWSKVDAPLPSRDELSLVGRYCQLVLDRSARHLYYLWLENRCQLTSWEILRTELARNPLPDTPTTESAGWKQSHPSVPLQVHLSSCTVSRF